MFNRCCINIMIHKYLVLKRRFEDVIMLHCGCCYNIQVTWYPNVYNEVVCCEIVWHVQYCLRNNLFMFSIANNHVLSICSAANILDPLYLCLCKHIKCRTVLHLKAATMQTGHWKKTSIWGHHPYAIFPSVLWRVELTF